MNARLRVQEARRNAVFKNICVRSEFLEVDTIPKTPISWRFPSSVYKLEDDNVTSLCFVIKYLQNKNFSVAMRLTVIADLPMLVKMMRCHHHFPTDLLRV